MLSFLAGQKVRRRVTNMLNLYKNKWRPRGPVARTLSEDSPFVRHRALVAGTTETDAHEADIGSFLCCIGAVCKSSAHDVILKIKLILLFLLHSWPTNSNQRISCRTFCKNRLVTRCNIFPWRVALCVCVCAPWISSQVFSRAAGEMNCIHVPPNYHYQECQKCTPMWKRN